jgi:hypothetical protein
MRSSLIINTAALAPHAATSSNLWRTGTYAERAKLVERIVDTCYGKWDEIIVAGNYKPDSAKPSRYIYIDVSPMYGDRRDALVQREMGARLSTGELLAFTHDDHSPDFAAKDIPDGDWHILVPKRIHGISGVKLPNGEEEGYMGGHTLIMRRDIWVVIPWLTVTPHRCWDLPMTRIWKEAGLNIEFSDDLVSIDLEAQEGQG